MSKSEETQETVVTIIEIEQENKSVINEGVRVDSPVKDCPPQQIRKGWIDIHIGDLIIFLFQWAFVPMLVIGVPEAQNYSFLGIMLVSIAPAILFSAIFYSIFRLTCRPSPFVKLIKNLHITQEPEKIINGGREYPPLYEFIIGHYHWEERVQGFTDAQGRYSTRRVTVKVFDYEERVTFKFDSWEDHSGQVLGLEKYKLAKVELEHKISYADEYTKNRVKQDFYEFKSNQKDTTLDRKVSIQDSKKRFIFIRGEKPWYIDIKIYIILHFLCLQYFYILFLELFVFSNLSFTYKKTIKINERK